MKLGTKIHSIHFVSLFILCFALKITYDVAKASYLDSATDAVNSTIENHKKNIINPVTYMNSAFEDKNPRFKQIMLYTKDRINNDAVPLPALKEELIEKFALHKTKIELIIVSRNNMIDASTDKNLIDSDLSKFPLAMKFLTQARKSNSVNTKDIIGRDRKEKELYYKKYYKLALNNSKEELLEIRFSIPLVMQKAIHFSHKNSDVLTEVYAVYKADNDHFYYVSMEDNTVKQKKYFGIDDKDSDSVERVFKSNENLIQHVDGNFIVHSKIYDKDKMKTPYESIIARFSVNLNESSMYLQKMQKIFIALFSCFLLIWIVTFFIIRRYLIEPLNLIGKKVSRGVSVPIDTFNTGSEFRNFASIYNELLYKFENQLARNEELLFTDHLTSALNRKAFDRDIHNYVEKFRQSGTQFSLLLIDIDNFKKVNDAFGHVQGDEVLIKISQLVKQIIDDNVDFYRLGGEEFAFIFCDVQSKEILASLKEFMNVLESHYSYLREESITISGGLSHITEEDDIESLYQRTDELMYHAKTSGKNKIVT